MSQFTVIPKAAPNASLAVDIDDAERVLSIVSNLDCPDADVLRDGKYAFSIQYGSRGMWIFYDRRRNFRSRNG